jgi:hypothetical protein
MKTKLSLTFLLFTFYFLLAAGQIPQGFNYQAIVRDGSNEIIAGQGMNVIVALHANSGSGTLLWQETNAVTSDQYGLVSFVVGDGPRTGGLANFTDIDWNAQTVFLKTTVEYPPGTFTVMGTTQVWAVPYSLTAKNVEGPVAKLGISGTTTDMEEPLFEVKNNTGQTVFAVYNQGVRIYVNDIDAKGAKGGFAIGGFGMTKTIPHQYMFISGDSVRFNIDNGDDDKGPKGGFAIGGFGTVKGLTQKYLTVSNDSVRIYVDNLDSDKGVKGGFAIGGYGIAKGKPQNLLVVNNDSVRIYIDNLGDDKGPKGGFAIGGYGTAKAAKQKYLHVQTTSTNIQVTDTLKGFSVTNIQGGGKTDFMKIDKLNSFIGHESGPKTAPSTTGEEGKYNVFLGYRSGKENTTGYKNVYMGYNSGLLCTSASHNTYVGNLSGVMNQTGRYNTFLGSYTGAYNTASENTFIGYSAGVSNSTGQHNTFLGSGSGTTVDVNSDNTFLGWGSGNSNNGSNNVFIGSSAGSSNTGGSGNVYIGYNANKYSTISSSNRLIIRNYYLSSNVPLIYGEFDNKRVVINGIHSDNPSNYTFYVNGTAGGDDVWNSLSDFRMKTNISTISDALRKVLMLRGVNFEWKDSSELKKGKHIGFIAQEVEPVLPEVVSKSEDTYMMQYGPISALLVEAVKDQQKIITGQQEVIKSLEDTTKQLQADYEMLMKEMNNIKVQINSKN